MNNICIVGNVCNDIELRETANGRKYCRLNIAVNRIYANADGERVTDFFNVTVWGARAETCAKYLKKGVKVAVTGSLENRSYEDKDGNKRVSNEINPLNVEFLYGIGNGNNEETEEKPRKSQKKTQDYEEYDEGDLPF